MLLIVLLGADTRKHLLRGDRLTAFGGTTYDALHADRLGCSDADHRVTQPADARREEDSRLNERQTLTLRLGTYIPRDCRMHDGIEPCQKVGGSKDLRSNVLRLIRAALVRLSTEQSSQLPADRGILSNDPLRLSITIILRITLLRYDAKYGRFAAAYAARNADEHI